MEFDKSRVYTAVNADELKVGSKVIYADSLAMLMDSVEDENAMYIGLLEKVREADCRARFFVDGAPCSLVYLLEESKLKWTDLKVGDVVTNGITTAMVTQIDKDGSYGKHIYAGYDWLTDSDLAEWEKVEE